MELTAASYGLSFLAGVLSTLSPCVLPLVPILMGSAAGKHFLGPFALVGGLMISFTAIGVGLGSLGGSIGLEQDTLRVVGGVLLLLFGALLVSSRLQDRFSAAVSRLGVGQGMLAHFNLDGLHGQFLLGLLLGVVWSPCVGPTLGVAITLASQGEALVQVASVMAVFSLGTGLPLLALGMLSRQAMGKWRGRMMNAGQKAKKLFGVALLLIGVLVLSGADKGFEKWAVNAMPEWMVNLTTRY
ncbi:MAG: cytochrome c biogenesis CcdA family protein [Gammaproteobacteria bacterium]|nr:cytochrome c biogenesis CcdA family protein [Gammaproteobacteria bacterium]MBU1446881.1 cytochrome c biogenesis CcdA family protein [Gammaproteobacteria bacterium]